MEPPADDSQPSDFKRNNPYRRSLNSEAYKQIIKTSTSAVPRSNISDLKKKFENIESEQKTTPVRDNVNKKSWKELLTQSDACLSVTSKDSAAEEEIKEVKTLPRKSEKKTVFGLLGSGSLLLSRRKKKEREEERRRKEEELLKEERLKNGQEERLKNEQEEERRKNEQEESRVRTHQEGDSLKKERRTSETDETKKPEEGVKSKIGKEEETAEVDDSGKEQAEAGILQKVAAEEETLHITPVERLQTEAAREIAKKAVTEAHSVANEESPREVAVEEIRIKKASKDKKHKEDKKEKSKNATEKERRKKYAIREETEKKKAKKVKEAAIKIIEAATKAEQELTKTSSDTSSKQESEDSIEPKQVSTKNQSSNKDSLLIEDTSDRSKARYSARNDKFARTSARNEFFSDFNVSGTKDALTTKETELNLTEHKTNLQVFEDLRSNTAPNDVQVTSKLQTNAQEISKLQINEAKSISTLQTNVAQETAKVQVSVSQETARLQPDATQESSTLQLDVAQETLTPQTNVAQDPAKLAQGTAQLRANVAQEPAKLAQDTAELQTNVAQDTAELQTNIAQEAATLQTNVAHLDSSAAEDTTKLLTNDPQETSKLQSKLKKNPIYDSPVQFRKNPQSPKDSPKSQKRVSFSSDIQHHPIPAPRKSLLVKDPPPELVKVITVEFDKVEKEEVVPVVIATREKKKSDVNKNYLVRKERKKREKRRVSLPVDDDIDFADPEHTIVRAAESTDTLDQIVGVLDSFEMDDKVRKKRSNSFTKIFRGFSRNKKKDEDKKKNKPENEVMVDNVQNENFNRNSAMRHTTDGQVRKLYNQDQNQKDISPELEERYAQLYINRFQHTKANFEQIQEVNTTEDYVCMDNRRNGNDNGNNRVNKYIDTSSSSNTLDSDNIGYSDNSNNSNPRYIDTPPRAFDTYQNMQLIKPKANIPISSERPLPLPYQDGNNTEVAPESPLYKSANREAQILYRRKSFNKDRANGPLVYQGDSIYGSKIAGGEPIYGGSKKRDVNSDSEPMYSGKSEGIYASKKRDVNSDSEAIYGSRNGEAIYGSRKEEPLYGSRSQNNQEVLAEPIYGSRNPSFIDQKNENVLTEPIYGSRRQNDTNVIYGSRKENEEVVSRRQNDKEPIYGGRQENQEVLSRRQNDTEPIYGSKKQNDGELLYGTRKQNDAESMYGSRARQYEEVQRRQNEEVLKEPIYGSRRQTTDSRIPIINQNQEIVNEPIYGRNKEKREPIYEGNREVIYNAKKDFLENRETIYGSKTYKDLPPPNFNIQRLSPYQDTNDNHAIRQPAQRSESFQRRSLETAAEINKRRSIELYSFDSRKPVGRNLNSELSPGEFNDGLYGNVYERKLVSNRTKQPSPDVRSQSSEGSMHSRSLGSRSPSLEGSKLRLPANREKIELQPRIKSPIPPAEVSTEKIIATELLKNKKNDKRTSPSHQRLEIEIDYPDNKISPRVTDVYVAKKPPISPQSKVNQLEAGEWHKKQRELNQSPSIPNTQVTTNAMVHADPSPLQQQQQHSRSTTPVIPRSPSSTASLQRTPPKQEIRQTVEAYCWKELKKLKEQQDMQLQMQLSNYGYAEDPVVTHRSRSMLPSVPRSTRRSSSLPRDVERQRRMVEVETMRRATNPNFIRNSPQRSTVGSSGYEAVPSRQRPIFQRGSLTQQFMEPQYIYNKKVSFHSPQNPENPNSWPTKNGYTQSPPQRRMDLKRETSLDDEVFLPPVPLEKEPIYATKGMEGLTNEEIFYINQQRQRQMRESRNPEPTYVTRREPIYATRQMPNISEEPSYRQPYNQYPQQRYDYPNDYPEQIYTYQRHPNQQIYSSRQSIQQDPQHRTTVNNKVCDMYGKIHDSQKSGVLYGQLQRNTNAPPMQHQSYNHLRNTNFVRGTRLTASVNDMYRQHYAPPDRPLPPIPNGNGGNKGKFPFMRRPQQHQQHHNVSDTESNGSERPQQVYQSRSIVG